MAKSVDIEKLIRMSLLIDIYGDLLTEKQRKFVQMHYEEDMSFQEIAETAGVTRQAVFDAVKNAEETFEKLESKLHLAEKSSKESPDAADNSADKPAPAADDVQKSGAGDIAASLEELKNKIAKQGVIYNTKWIINEINDIIEKLNV